MACQSGRDAMTLGKRPIRRSRWRSRFRAVGRAWFHIWLETATKRLGFRRSLREVELGQEGTAMQTVRFAERPDTYGPLLVRRRNRGYEVADSARRELEEAGLLEAGSIRPTRAAQRRRREFLPHDGPLSRAAPCPVEAPPDRGSRSDRREPHRLSGTGRSGTDGGRVTRSVGGDESNITP